MDPISVAVLAALAGGAGGEFGRQTWAGLTALIRRPFRRGEDTDPAAPTGEDELAALAQAPDDSSRAAALHDALRARAAADPEFGQALREWWAQAQQAAPTGRGDVHNVVRDTTVNGPMIQGQDFGSLTFNLGTPPPPPQP
ncbi:hypothetical protein GCM10027168_52840 [Streptomyces capparidis]